MKAAILMPVAEQRGGAEWMLLHLLEASLRSGSRFSVLGSRLGGSALSPTESREPRAENRLSWQVIFLQDGPMVEQVRRLGVPARMVPAGRLRQGGRFMTTVCRVARIVHAERLDVLVSWMATAHLYGGPAALLARVPALWFQLGMPEASCAIDRLATLLPARGVFTCSHAAALAQAALSPGRWQRTLRPTRVVYPGVELERFSPERAPSPAEARRLLNLPADGPLIGCVGRLQQWKGMHVLIDAMPSVLARHPNARCVLVGGEHATEPDYAAELRRRIDRLGIGARVALVGLQRNIPLWMQAMDVIVHASRQEPFGMVVIEAMALGKAVVAGAEGGPAEIVTEGVDGLLAPYGDAPALAAAIVRYLDDPTWASGVGAAARQRAASFSTERYAEELTAGVADLAFTGKGSARPREALRLP